MSDIYDPTEEPRAFDGVIRSAGDRPLAVVTGASSGIGYELATLAANEGYDLIVASDEPSIVEAAHAFEMLGVQAASVQTDLSTTEGVDKLLALIGERPVEALMANAGHGLGNAFLDQDWPDARHVIDTNITGTAYLIHKVVGGMRARDEGKVLLTGSIAGLMPGSYAAVYNGTKAFIDSFAWALREELRDSNVTISCLLPGPTDTQFFDRADMTDTKVGQGKKQDPAEVAKTGFNAMLKGEGDVIAGLKNKIQGAMAAVTPQSLLAKMHADMAEPGSGERS